MFFVSVCEGMEDSDSDGEGFILKVYLMIWTCVSEWDIRGRACICDMIDHYRRLQTTIISYIDHSTINFNLVSQPLSPSPHLTSTHLTSDHSSDLNLTPSSFVNTLYYSPSSPYSTTYSTVLRILRYVQFVQYVNPLH